ncbi:M3K19 kinase, partial [Amia calva]|nr:M3K19 kinase [Amia calva]
MNTMKLMQEFLEAVLEGDLEEVHNRLEHGDFALVNVNSPHTDTGCTPLITASQRAQPEAVRFLLEKGADVTLCNHSNQTAVHVASPSIQGGLLLAVNRTASPQGQLLQSAWQGDLDYLQHLLSQKKPVDVNIQNLDGLTALMLTVRDVDLFESLGALMPSEYRPVEVVKELLRHLADASLCDFSGRSALSYAAQIQSGLKFELIQLLEDSLSDSEQNHLDFEYFHVEEPLTHPLSSSPLENSVIIESSPDSQDRVEESTTFRRRSKSTGDQGISLYFQTAVKTLHDLREAYGEMEELSSQGTSLPSLWHRYSREKQFASSPVKIQLMKNRRPCPPVASKSTGRYKPKAAGPGLSDQPQLTRSEPCLMEPMLDSSSLLKIKAHIHNRLGLSEPEQDINCQKVSLPTLKAKPVLNQKLLAPLSKGREKGIPELKFHLPFRPKALVPLSPKVSKVRRERLSRKGSEGSSTARTGSEDSSSSCLSSQGSFDMDEERNPAEAVQEQSGRPKENPSAVCSGDNIECPVEHLFLACSNRDTDHRPTDPAPDPEPIDTNAQNINFVGSNYVVEGVGEVLIEANKTDLKQVMSSKPSQIISGGKVMDTVPTSQDNLEKISKKDGEEASSGESVCLDNPPKGDLIPELEKNILVEDRETNGIKSLLSKREADKIGCNAELKQLVCPIVSVTVSVADVQAREESKPHKTPKNKVKMTNTHFNVNQTFNILAHKEHHQHSKKTKSNLRNRCAPSHMNTNIRTHQELIIDGEGAVKPASPKTNAVRITQRSAAFPLFRNGQAKSFQLSTNKSPVERKSFMRSGLLVKKMPLQCVYKSTGLLKKPATPITPRAKSAVDYVKINYSDMFQEIDSNDEGPAIYEMFATPVYSNLRASTACEKRSYRAIQSAPVRKSLGGRNTKCTKGIQHCKLKKNVKEKNNSASVKQNKRRDVFQKGKHLKQVVSEDEQEHTVFISGPNWNIKTSKSQVIFPEDLENCTNLSIVEEIRTHQLTDETARSRTHTDNTTAVPSEDQNAMNELCEKLSSRSKQNKGGLYTCHDGQKTGATDAQWKINSKSFQTETKINTWTSESDRTVSPAFRKLLDSAGDGDLTDELLRCLAEELISLEEKDLVVRPEHSDAYSHEIRAISEEAPSPSEEQQDLITAGNGWESSGRATSASNTEDAIMWTKGEILGRGAYGTVYCGLTSQGQLIAVKQVTLDYSDEATAEKEYQRLQEEVDLLKTLEHINIVGFLGTSLTQNIVSIFMEYVPGGSIASIINRFGPLPEKVFAIYTKQILEGVAYLHSNRVIHRDLKGNNVMLMPTGIIKLIDFGCAKRLVCLTASGTSSELLKSVHGTPYWMAPEVINETGHGRKSDIWSVGCTVFEMATGKPPLAHMDKMAALFYIGARRGLMPALPDDFSKNARSFVQACLTSDQRERPSAEELLRHAFIPRPQPCAH